MSDRIILGIESSCDETAGALLLNGREVLAQFVAGQTDLHRQYGGVVPEIACRAHLECMIPGIDSLFKTSGISPSRLSAIAVTNRPGLIGALLVGVAAAKGLALAWGKPLIGVNHIEAHIAAATFAVPEMSCPFVALVVSGGHTNLYRVTLDPETGESYECLGHTLDDAAGEAFDKAAKLLGLGFPGGPRVEKIARGGNPRAHNWKNTCLPEDGKNFSFSGLKTAVLYAARGRGGRKSPLILDEQGVADAAASFQAAVTHALTSRAVECALACGSQWVAIGGGVAANGALREEMAASARENGLKVAIPPMSLCTDNAVMVAARADSLFKRGQFDGLDLETAAR